MSLSRRQVIVGAAAASCVGCTVSTDGSESIAAATPSATSTPAPPVAESAQSQELQGGFGDDMNLGSVAEVVQTIRDNDGFWYVPQGRAWLTEYPADSLERARDQYSGPELRGMEVGLVALFQKCPHLGCRVPSCATSQFFECPCHGSKYNQVGEKHSGPAPRGMDRFAVEIRDGEVIVKTNLIIQGPAIGTNTTGQAPAGEFCIGVPESE